MPAVKLQMPYKLQSHVEKTPHFVLLVIFNVRCTDFLEVIHAVELLCFSNVKRLFLIRVRMLVKYFSLITVSFNEG